MKHFMVLALLFVSFSSLAQLKNKLSLVAQLQPELTLSSTNINSAGKKGYQRFNIGVTLAAQYKVADRWWIDAGLGFISRGVATFTVIDQQHLPKPYFDSNALARFVHVAAYRTLQFPVGIGYNFCRKKKAEIFARASFIPNFLLNAKYKRLTYPSFKKNIWQGYSLNAGLGFDYKLSKKLKLTNSLSYSFVNTAADDPYIDGDEIHLKHKYIQLSTGVKLSL